MRTFKVTIEDWNGDGTTTPRVHNRQEKNIYDLLTHLALELDISNVVKVAVEEVWPREVKNETNS